MVGVRGVVFTPSTSVVCVFFLLVVGKVPLNYRRCRSCHRGSLLLQRRKDKPDRLQSAMPLNSFIPESADEPVSVVSLAIATMIRSKENRFQSAMPLNSFTPEVADEPVSSFAFVIANP
jgi:hypothetical protein